MNSSDTLDKIAPGMPPDLARLRDPFPASDIEWRVARCGVSNGKPWALVLAYITSRAVMDRFDAVCGPQNWRNEFATAPGGGVLCGLSIRVGGEWVTKWDGADNTEIEAVKGGLSSATKRSAVVWGVGRYLYNLTENFAECRTDRQRDWHKGYHKETKTSFWWQPPALPQWALPKGETPAPTQRPTVSAPKNQEPTSAQIDTAQDLYDRLTQTADGEDKDAFRDVWKETFRANEEGRITPTQYGELADTKDKYKKALKL